MKLHRSKTTGAALFVAAISSATIISSTANGQDGALEPQGDFALTVSLTESASATPVAIGNGQMAMAVTQTAHLFNESGEGFLNFAVGTCASYQVIDVAANTAEITGYCSYADADGDQVFEQFATDGAVALDAISLTGMWLSGTGKYESLEGEVTTELSASVQQGDAVLIGGRKTGSYTIANAIPEPEPEPAPTPEVDTEALMAALMEEGEDNFNRNCAGCHGRDGGGGVGPRLAGNSFLSSSGATVGQILVGNEEHGMPPFADDLDDREIASIATYVRNSWGNDYGIVQERSVAIRR